MSMNILRTWKERAPNRKKSLVAGLICLLAISTSAPPALAGMIGTQEAFNASARTLQLQRVDRLLDGSTVQQQLEQFGLSSAEASERIHALSDSELETLAERLDSLPAGAGALEVLGAVFLVLIVLEVLGVTSVFQNL